MIPHLELQAAVLASRLCKTIEKEVRIQLKESILFTGSAIFLAWICSQGRRLKPFVSSCVGEIQDNVQPVQWRHIPTKHNVADDVASGLPVAELSDRWKNGPEFLYLPKENWPVDSAILDLNEVERKCRNVQVLGAATTNETTVTCIIDLERFSSWKRFVQVTALVHQLSGKFWYNRAFYEASMKFCILTLILRADNDEKQTPTAKVIFGHCTLSQSFILLLTYRNYKKSLSQ